MIAYLMDEVVLSKLKEREEGTHIAPLELENCEVCGHLMPDGCIGWCPDCVGDPDEGRRREWAAFWAWIGWRRAFAEGEPIRAGTVCGL